MSIGMGFECVLLFSAKSEMLKMWFLVCSFINTLAERYLMLQFISF
jgi:hypothetical protein